MKIKFLIFFTLLLTLGCQDQNPNSSDMSQKEIKKDNSIAMADTTPKITGIGGIFFFSKNIKKTKDWYAKNLGLAVDDYGSAFEFRNANRPDEINYLRWSLFDSIEQFSPSKKEFMINYRVQNIEGLVNKLRANGVKILDEIATYEYGKFVHLLDEDGNKIELWEPLDSFFTKMGGPTTK